MPTTHEAPRRHNSKKHWSFYPSVPFTFPRFNMRHPVIWVVNFPKEGCKINKHVQIGASYFSIFIVKSIILNLRISTFGALLTTSIFETIYCLKSCQIIYGLVPCLFTKYIGFNMLIAGQKYIYLIYYPFLRNLTTHIVYHNLTTNDATPILASLFLCTTM